MRLKGLDLNLLVVLDALLTERSVSRAAQRIGLKQSAVSSALGRLRDHFDDALLEWRNRQMTPTTLGYELQSTLRTLLQRADVISNATQAFAPAAALQEFVVLCSDYVAQVFMPRVIARLMKEAPGASLSIRPLITTLPRSRNLMGDELERRGAHLAIAPKEFTSADRPSVDLFREAFTCIVATDNPHVGEQLSTRQYSALPHVIATFMDSAASTVEGRRLERAGVARRVDVTVPNFLLVPEFVIGTERIGTVPSRLADALTRSMPLRAVPAPFPAIDVWETLQISAAHSGDPAVEWLGHVIVDCARDF
ncbi:LysR family transcriptional regulator [Caballeronia glebae]|uniref:LysR family transcriptional regulator n=2 Tax=Caballeronia glebae TaxID=1777143 RepID=A0A158A3L2_9BURK|nr:LysR family transcriptional regulator [Caballeronia glebae]